MRPTVPEVIPFVRAYYQLGQSGDVRTGVGGSLHVMLDDQNIGGDIVEFCRQWAVDRHDRAGELLAMLLGRMSRTQQLKVCSAHDAYGTPAPEALQEEAALCAAMEDLLKRTA